MSTAKKVESEQEPILSGAHQGPACDREDCGGYRTWDVPGPLRLVNGHCGCPVGRRVAEVDYGQRHGKPPALTPDELLGLAS